jgi:hypothetical protein
MSTEQTPQDGPWCAGQAECIACGHEWVAAWPLGADALECPDCGSTDTDRIAQEAA